LHQVGDIFELNVKLRCQKVKPLYNARDTTLVHFTAVCAKYRTGSHHCSPQFYRTGSHISQTCMSVNCFIHLHFI